MTPSESFHCEVEKLKDKDERGNQVTTVKCHGRLFAETAGKMKVELKPLISQGGRIVVDLGDVNYLDSAGLGALVGLKRLPSIKATASWNSPT